MNESQWFIRLGAEELGPVSSQELRCLAEQGAVKRETPVSSDRQNWQQARTVEGLVFGQAATMPSMSGTTTNEWLEASKLQAKTILSDLRRMDFRSEIVPIDETNLMTLLKDGIFWFATLLGIVPLLIITLANTNAQIVAFALFFAAVWGVIFRSAILKHNASWKVLLPAMFFTGLLGTAAAGKIENVLLPLFVHGYATALLGCILVIGVCEELAKVVPVVGYLLWKRSAANPMTIILVGVFSGLGFAAFENLIYSQLMITLTEQARVAGGTEGLAEGVQGAMVNSMLRSLSCVFCHAVWGGIFAYFLATASFSHRRWGALFVVGLALTAVLHGCYDWFVDMQQTLAALTAGLSFVLFYGYVAKLRQAMPCAKAADCTESATAIPEKGLKP